MRRNLFPNGSGYRPVYFCLLLFAFLTGCSAIGGRSLGAAVVTPPFPAIPTTAASTSVATASPTTLACTITAPVLAEPPDDPAVINSPAPGYYFINEDRSIWVSALPPDAGIENAWRAGDKGNKVGWFRPAGVDLEITGRRLDGPAATLVAEVPCCYPTRFQATGLYFPFPGCWEVSAKAGDRTLSFTVWIEPAE